MDIERHITLLALVYSLKPVFGGEVALQVVVLIIPCVAVVQDRVAFEGGGDLWAYPCL